MREKWLQSGKILIELGHLGTSRAQRCKVISFHPNNTKHNQEMSWMEMLLLLELYIMNAVHYPASTNLLTSIWNIEWIIIINVGNDGNQRVLTMNYKAFQFQQAISTNHTPNRSLFNKEHKCKHNGNVPIVYLTPRLDFLLDRLEEKSIDILSSHR